MESRMKEIKLDLEDLNSLLENASRQKSKDLLSLEIRKLQSELIKLQTPEPHDVEMKKAKPVSSTPKIYDIKLNNYAWDQSDNFVKLYVTLANVQSLSKEAVSCNFHETSIDLHVTGLENKNYILSINNLCEIIDPEKSFIKVKTDMIIVCLAKKAKKNWSCVTSVEKLLKDAKDNSFKSTNDMSDPNASIMNLMKKMYEEGDDDMKRTIAKAWTESQEKKEKGLMGDLPSF